MTPAEERDGPLTDPNLGTDTNDRVTPAAQSTARVIAPPEPRPSDTLLSVPPATRADLALDERVSAVERRLDELTVRVEHLERRPVDTGALPPQVRWFWLVFLAGLALAWQILAHFR